MSRIHLRAESAPRPYSAGTGLCGGAGFGSAGTVAHGDADLTWRYL